MQEVLIAVGMAKVKSQYGHSGPGLLFSSYSAEYIPQPGVVARTSGY